MDQEILIKDIILENNNIIIKNFNTNNLPSKCSIMYANSDEDLFDDFIKNIEVKDSKVVFSNRDKCNTYLDYIIILLSKEIQISIKKIKFNEASIFLKYNDDISNIGRTNIDFFYSSLTDLFTKVRSLTKVGLLNNKNYSILDYKLGILLDHLKEVITDYNLLYDMYFE